MMPGKLAERCRGRWPSILMQLGINLGDKALAHRNTACPMCGGTDRFHFTDRDGVGLWHCRGCGEGGDGVRLVMRMKRVGFKEAAALIEGVIGGAERTEPRGKGGALRDPLKPWRNARPFILGTLAATYLKNRELALTVDEARSLRFDNALWHWPSEMRWPAVVALIRRADGTELTAHQTFLAADGSSKAPVDRPRLFPAGRDPTGGGVWFGTPDPEREFIVGEGIESTISAMRLYESPAGCAALSAHGVRRLILPAEARRVRIFADNDLDGKGLAAAVEARLRWRAEGRSVAVSYSKNVGEDANDILVRRLKVQGHV
jgi:putative DNA primase/helicase